MFEKEDFSVESWPDFFSFLLVTPFLVFVLPFVGAVWTLGFVEDLCGWLDT
jgi:hypothetical protein